ncbi:TetR/AcrR family transcriptional regulator [Melioribacteraceae bacterium 4301-Me]|uniref:TetR/AcrR family transcriptional regulator n=1 Tax=Pyranulibacter aquaticus TaxID=3163344 RepID=UPI003595DF21
MGDERLKEKTIIEAARNRFAHYGFSKVTMDEIASDVGMGKASLYYYFPTKEELFKSVILEEQNEFVKNLEAILQKNTLASEKLNEYVAQRIKYFRDLVNLGMLSVHSIFDVKSIFKKLFEDLGKQELLLLKKIFDEGITSGEFTKELPKNFPDAFLHVLQGLRLRIIKHFNEHQKNEDAYKELESEMRTLTYYIINGIKNK